MKLRRLRLVASVLLLWTLAVPAVADDVFSTDDGSGGGKAGLDACTDKCTGNFADGAYGDPPCANFELERCVHQCHCDVDPDCGPEPKHPEEAQYCPIEELPTGDGSKGLTRKECEEAGAKGIVRQECQELQKQDCLEEGAKGIFRKECIEIVRTDCEDAGEKGLKRVDCGNLMIHDCLEEGAKGIHRTECEDVVEERTAECKKAAGPDPVVSSGQLVAALNWCLSFKSAADWFVSPDLVVLPGALAFHQPATRTVTYDPATLDPLSLYEKSFLLTYAYADYFLDLEHLRLGTERSDGETSTYRHEIAGFLAHCLSSSGLYPEQITLCPDARAAQQEFLARSEPSLDADDAAAAHEAWTSGWSGYGAGLPGALRHEPHRGVIEWAQQVLTALGYKPGPADGLMGPRTATAVRAFEEANGLEPTGVLHEKVIDLLVQQAASLPGIPPKPADSAN